MENRQKIARISSVMRLACSVYLLLAPLLLVYVWLNFERFAAKIAASAGVNIQMEYLGVGNVLLGFVLAAIPIGLLMYGVWRLRKLFALYHQGILFTAETAGHLHAFASMLLLTVLMSPILRALLSVVLTMDNPPGQRSISFSFGSDGLVMIFMVGILFAVSWIMREGQRLAAENEEFV